jgi:predicted RNA-binding protein with PIN domain
MEPRTIVVDGYNVIRQVPALLAAEARGLAAGREALLGQVVACYRQTPHRVVVVFDGAQQAQSVAPLRCGVRSQIIYSARHETADSVIVRLVAAERLTGALVVVATDDLAVRLSGQHHGAAAASAGELAARLNAAPRHLAHAARHRAAVRAQLEPDDSDDRARRDTARKGNPRRAPRQRRGQAPRSPL